MKTYREYHVEYYWDMIAEKKRMRAKLKDKLIEGLACAATIGGIFALTYEFLRQLFEVI